MTQDTRKDRRVKIVSLNVRYKSATVDEFIENHAHDVSRGGIFIKTGNPFPPGTLLKFEIRLASDQAVIAGVGRIVWKRDAGIADGEHPAGMGVKFIKIDDPSKSVIDRLVNSKTDAGRAYENVREDGSDRPFSRSSPPGRPALASTTPPPASGAARAAVPGSIPPAAGGPSARSPSVPPETSKSRLQSMPTTAATPFARKSTIMGLGISSNPPGRPSSAPPGGGTTSGAGSIPPAPRVPFSSAPAVPPRPTSTTAMFPRAHDDDDMPAKEDQTVMRQAAELLEDALREAGGSMADVGQNPLFASATGITATQTTAGKPAAGSVPASKSAGETGADAADSPGPVPVAQSVRREQPASKRESATPSSRRPAASSTRSPAIASTAAEPEKKKGSGGAFILAIVAAAAIAAVVAFRDQLFGRSTPPEPAATPTAPTTAAATSVTAAEVPPTPPPATAAPAPTPSAAPEPVAASTSARVEAPPPTPPARPPQVYVPPRPRPAARPAPAPVAAPPTQTSESAPTAEPAPVTPAATATTAPETVSSPTTAPAQPTETTAPSASPAPTPTKAKPKGPDDNPY